MSCLVPIVLDNGTASLKAGFACETVPRSHVPNLVGRPKYTVLLSEDFTRPHLYFGHEAQGKRGCLLLSSPMHNSVVVDWDDMLGLWSHLFNQQLRVDTSEHPLLITETINGPRLFRESLISALFEAFDFPAVFIAYQTTLALYGSGRTTGLIVNCGESSTCVVPIVESFCLPTVSYRHNIAGATITSYLQRLLTGVGCRMGTTSELEIVREIKESLCYIATDGGADQPALCLTPESYQLPDGNRILLGAERHTAPEIIFTNGINGHEHKGLSHLVAEAILKSPRDACRTLASNIVLTGGTTLFTGFRQRLEGDLKSLVPSNIGVDISAPKDRINTVWLGGSVLASLDSFDQMWITQKEYTEWGDSILERKFI